MSTQKYRNGKIYILRSSNTDNVYIGSTIQKLHKRLHTHKSVYKKFLENGKIYTSSCEIIKKGNYYIELVELYPCDDKFELLRREGELIRSTQYCINSRIAGRTKEQYAIDEKQKIDRIKKIYRDKPENKEKQKGYMKKYNIDNKTSEDNRKKIWYDNNKLRILKNRKTKYNDNKDELKIKAANLYNETSTDCPCGGKYSQKSKNGHMLTNKHLKYLNPPIITPPTDKEYLCECGTVLKKTTSKSRHKKSKIHLIYISSIVSSPIILPISSPIIPPITTYLCECGVVLKKTTNKVRHEKSKKHLDNI
jgi:hypothetical protein